MRIDGLRVDVAEKQRVAVRMRAHRELGADEAGCSPAIVHDDLLAHDFGQPGGACQQ